MNQSTGYVDPNSVNADFSASVVVDSSVLPWLPSPRSGVERRMLDRVGGEVARATSIVRYAPKSEFHAHEHGGGEEFLVLEGTFSDEHGDYPAGTYVRNPPGSRHAPFTRNGCIILVKLRQMQPHGEPHIVIDTRTQAWQAGVSGYAVKPLFEARPGGERVALLRLSPGTGRIEYCCDGGEELFVLDGTLHDREGAHDAGTWLRKPHGQRQWLASDTGCEVWVKRGHLCV